MSKEHIEILLDGYFEYADEWAQVRIREILNKYWGDPMVINYDGSRGSITITPKELCDVIAWAMDNGSDL